MRIESGLKISPRRAKASCNMVNAAACIHTVVPLGPTTSPGCRVVLAAVLQGKLRAPSCHVPSAVCAHRHLSGGEECKMALCNQVGSRKRSFVLRE